jgi:hypothetical protein
VTLCRHSQFFTYTPKESGVASLYSWWGES